MGQCGCGDFQPDKVYRLPDGTRVAVELYPGCQYCGTPLGVQLHFFAPGTGDFFGLDELPTEDVTPDKYGACLAGLPIMAPEDLCVAAAKTGEVIDPSRDDAYETVSDYLEDQALTLLQTAMRVCQKRARGRNGEAGS